MAYPQKTVDLLFELNGFYRTQQDLKDLVPESLIQLGADQDIKCKVIKANKEPLDLSGIYGIHLAFCTYYDGFDIRQFSEGFNSQTPTENAVTGMIEITDAANGLFTIHLTPADTAILPVNQFVMMEVAFQYEWSIYKVWSHLKTRS